MSTNDDIALQLGKALGVLELLTKKVDHNCKASVEGDKAILKKIEEMDARVAAMMAEHREYHKANEAKWGPWAYLKKKPAAGIAAGAMLALAFGDRVVEVVPKVVKLLSF